MFDYNTANFTDRDSYLAWRAEWRTAYKAISQTIREAKPAFKNQQRRIVVVKGKWGNDAMIDGKSHYVCREYGDALSHLQKSQNIAREMMAALGEAYEKKEELIAKAKATV